MERLKQALTDFRADRPVLDSNNTPDNLLNMLTEELYELAEAHESGDIDNIREESADVLILIVNYMMQQGIDPVEAGMEKVALNHVQHSAVFYQEGDYKQQYKQAKQYVKDRNMKDQFYER